MNFLNKKIIALASWIYLVPVFVLAQVRGGAPTTGTKIDNPLSPNISTVNDFIKVMLEGIIKMGIPVIAIAIVYCGFLFVSAQGNSEKISTAKNALLYTLIGAAVLIGSWALAQLISETVLAL